MRTLLACFLAFLGSANSLQAADSSAGTWKFAGTWKLNVARSKLAPAPPGMSVKDDVAVAEVISVKGEPSEQGTVKRTLENGTVISIRYTVPLKGGPLTFSEGAPPAGTAIIMKVINDSVVDTITTRDGKAISTSHFTLSANGKTMRVETKGVDAQGKPVQGLGVYDKQ
jgi:hypothetical protein